MLIFVENRKIFRGNGRGLILCDLLSHTNRRHAHFIVQFQTRINGGTLFIDANFTGTNDATNVAFRHTFGDAKEVIVQALTFGIGTDLDPNDLVGLGLRLRRGNERNCFR